MNPFLKYLRTLVVDRCIKLVVMTILLVYLLYGVNLCAQESSQITQTASLKSVKFGFDNYYRCGSFNPLWLTIQAGNEPLAGSVELELQDADGESYRIFIQNISLAAREQRTIETSIQAARKPCDLKVFIVPSSTTLENQSKSDQTSSDSALSSHILTKPLVQWGWADPQPLDHALLSTQQILLEVGPAMGLSRLAPRPKRTVGNSVPDQKSLGSIHLETIRDLPTDFRSYESIYGAVIALKFDDATKCPNQEQSLALKEWVRSGGKLLICATSKSTDAKTELPPALRDLLPGEIAGFIPVAKFAPWEDFINSEFPIPASSTAVRMLIPKWSKVRGNVLLAQDTNPLVIEHSVGLGKVIVASIDFSEIPISAWSNNQRLLRQLAPWHWPSENEISNLMTSQSNRLGYTDLIGQLFVRMNQIPNAPLPSFWLMMIVGITTALAWFPLQAIAMKNLRSPFLRWAVLLGIMTVLVLICFKGTEGNSERSFSVKHVEIVDLHPAMGRVQSQSWATLFSPTAESIKVEIAPLMKLQSSNQNSTQFAWFGLPGKGWGGLDSQLISTVSINNSYRISSRTADEITFPTGTVKAFRAQWSHDFPPDAPVALTKQTSNQHLNGVLHNKTNLTLKNCFLYYENWALNLGTIVAGQKLTLADFHSRELSRASALAGRKNQTADAVPYNRQAADLHTILSMLMMHRAAGGNTYTGLSNSIETHLDQTDALTSDQAILIGWGDAATQWKVKSSSKSNNDKEFASHNDVNKLNASDNIKPAVEQNPTAYRIWLPVTLINENPSETTPEITEIRFPQTIAPDSTSLDIK